MRKITYFSLFYIIIILSIINVIADNDSSGELFGGELAEGTGSAAIGFMLIGSVYILLKRTHILSKIYLKDEQKELKDNIRSIYKTLRQPLLTIHYWTNIIATILAIIHGILLSDANSFVVIFGWIAAGSMFILSFSGVIIWKRFKPIWDFKTSRSAIRYLHRQWLFTGLMLIGLLGHSAFS